MEKIKTISSLDKKKINFKSEFEDFLYECIFKDIPYCFLAKYNAIINDTKKILLEPKIVLSGTHHFHNEKFKFWIAEKYHQNYERLHTNNPYIQNVSIPRLKRFQEKFPELLKENFKY